jgi:hypothetical protein
MLAMDQKSYELIGTDYPGNRAVDVKNPLLSTELDDQLHICC